MNSDREIRSLSLSPGEVRVLGSMSGMEVRCVAGRIWLTQYGDDRDLVLGAGQVIVPASASVVVVSASRGARLEIGPTAAVHASRPSLWQRLLALVDPRSGSAVMRQLEGRVGPARDPVRREARAPRARPTAQRPEASRALFSSNSRMRSS